METLDTENIDPVLLSSDRSRLGRERFIRFPHPAEPDIDTETIPKEPTTSYKRWFYSPQKISERSAYLNESLGNWWEGQVVKVHSEDGYFEANLHDLKGVSIAAEFDIDQVLENPSSIKQYLFPGAKFIFFIYTIHGKGAPIMASRVEFIPPYIWREEDEQEAKKKYSELFPYDPPL